MKSLYVHLFHFLCIYEQNNKNFMNNFGKLMRYHGFENVTNGDFRCWRHENSDEINKETFKDEKMVSFLDDIQYIKSNSGKRKNTDKNKLEPPEKKMTDIFNETFNESLKTTSFDFLVCALKQVHEFSQEDRNKVVNDLQCV